MWRAARRAIGLAVALVYLLVEDAHAEVPPCPLTRGDTRAIARVLDGETLLLDDGRHLRLIGALAPRAADVGAKSGSWPPENATREALVELVVGRSAVLWHDTVQRDRYGQVLAHVTIDGAWLQGALVTRGFARAYGRPGGDACAEPLAKLERGAREEARGLWANAAYSVRAASRDEWDNAAGTFHVVSGTVRRVSRGSSEVYVSLGARRGRTYPLAAVVPGNRADLTSGIAVRSLVGRRVLVRGWIEQRRGPVIVIDTKGQLELIDTSQ